MKKEVISDELYLRYVIDAVKKFILKHDIVINSKEYRSVWDSARVHGVVYQGETYADEIEELRKISKEE